MNRENKKLDKACMKCDDKKCSTNGNKGAFTRTCIACNSKKNKHDLIRIAYTKNKEISIDIEGKKEGRGIYLCYDLECLNKIIKTKKIERKLKNVISQEFYENIRGVIIDKEEAKNIKNDKQNGGDV